MRNLSKGIIVGSIILIVVIVFVALSGCAPSDTGITIADESGTVKKVEYIVDATTKSKAYTNELVRFYDEETDIYCYVVDYSENVSVSCVANPHPVP